MVLLTQPLKPALPSKPTTMTERKRAARMCVPRSSVHGLVLGAKVHFETGRPVEEGAYFKPYKKLLVDVAASKACLDKALGLANDLFNAFEAAGHRAVMASSGSGLRGTSIDEREVRAKKREHWHHSGLWSPYRPTVVYVGDVAFGLAIVEMSEEVVLRYVGGKYVREADYVPPKRHRNYTDHSWTTTRELPSGRLRILAYSPYYQVSWSVEWQETKKVTLNSALRSIVKSLEDAAPEIVAKIEEAERKAEVARLERLVEKERWRRKEDRRRVEQSIKDSKEDLAQVIERWSKTMEIERFLAGVESRAVGPPAEQQGHIVERLKLARDFLGDQDPLAFFMSWRTPEERYRPA